jgi:carboxyl-terminal processing protease
MRKAGWLLAAVVPAAVSAFVVLRAPSEPVPAVARAAASGRAPAAASGAAGAGPNAAGAGDDPSGVDDREDDRSYVFRMPSGEPTALTCEEARIIVDQVRAGLAYAPENVPAQPLAASTADWLDPHGLLSLAKDAPTARAIAKVAPELVADLEGRRQRDCASALGPGAALAKWTDELRAAFDRGRRTQTGAADAGAAAKEDLDVATLEPLPPTASGREMAFEIGRRAGAFEAAYGDAGRRYADEARRRFFPPLDAEGWAKVVLASAVRAYVPLLDPHGEWAPFDEESRIYEVDLASRPPSRLWGRAVPTAIGVRLTDAPTAPLAVDDVVLSVGAVTTVGLPLEQVDQLGFAASDAPPPRAGAAPLAATVLRAGKIVRLELGKPAEPAPVAARASADLPSERIAFGDGDVLVVGIKDVRDDLGDELASLVDAERDRSADGSGRKLTGVVLDLRGNGGGSTDGAMGALSLFLPGAPLFAMKRRDGTIEIDRAPVPRDQDRWTGPVATFVDANTASAAEMIAGALAAYRRGPTVGTATFGKGCAQEYVDDDAHAGVLRLTTLVYALPDGTPVQRVGLAPQIRFPFVAESDGVAQDREAKLAHSAPPWRGPDLRDRAAAKIDAAAWPANGGAVGPCHEADTCRALRLLGAPKRTPVAKH